MLLSCAEKGFRHRGKGYLALSYDILPGNLSLVGSRIHSKLTNTNENSNKKTTKLLDAICYCYLSLNIINMKRNTTCSSFLLLFSICNLSITSGLLRNFKNDGELESHQRRKGKLSKIHLT